MQPLRSRVKTLGKDIAATTTPSDSRCSQSGFPRTRVPSQASISDATDGATNRGTSGMTPVRRPGNTSRAPRTPSIDAGSTRFAITAMGCACAAVSSASATPAVITTSSGVRSWPDTTSTTGEPRSAATLALKFNSAGVETSV